jgi:hypothetical protein
MTSVRKNHSQHPLCSLALAASPALALCEQWRANELALLSRQRWFGPINGPGHVTCATSLHRHVKVHWNAWSTRPAPTTSFDVFPSPMNVRS